MADTNNHNMAPKTDSAPRAVEKAADTAPKAAEKAAPAPAKQAAKATAKAATAPAKAAARRARKAVPARRRGANKNSAPKRTAARAAVKTATTNSINKGTRTMKNEAKQAADRVQAVFGDANERAKNVIERNNRIAEEMTELTKGNVEALVASTKAAAKGVETLGQEVAEFGRRSFEEASATIRGFAEVKSPTDLFRLQAEFARGQFDAMVAESSRISETMIKLAGDVAQPITNRYSVAAERVRTAVAA